MQIDELPPQTDAGWPGSSRRQPWLMSGGARAVPDLNANLPKPPPLTTSSPPPGLQRDVSSPDPRAGLDALRSLPIQHPLLVRPMHLSDPSSATNHATAMPGTLCEAPNSFAAAPANLKKRKRDAVAPSQGQEPTAFVPSSIPHLNAPFYSGPQDVDRLMSGSKCLLATEADLARPGAQPALAAKRRRLMQQQQQQQQQQEQWPGVGWSAPQGKLYPLNTSLNVPPRSSPPVSPKTIPEYDQHVLRPCHICHRRPTTREVLDAYADCDRCGERACYICLRECTAADCGGATPVAPDAMDDGPLDEPMAGQAYRYGERIKRRRVCAWCAVEGLTDSGVEIVRCLDCVRGVASNIPRGP